MTTLVRHAHSLSSIFKPQRNFKYRLLLIFDLRFLCVHEWESLKLTLFTLTLWKHWLKDRFRTVFHEEVCMYNVIWSWCLQLSIGWRQTVIYCLYNISYAPAKWVYCIALVLQNACCCVVAFNFRYFDSVFRKNVKWKEKATICQ